MQLEHVHQSFLQELLVNAHELCNESLQVKDGLAAQLHPVFVIGCHGDHTGLQCPITVDNQFRQETLGDRVGGEMVTNKDVLQ